MNRQAVEFAEKLNLPGTAGSDAHGLSEFGSMGLELPDFHDADSLRKAIQQARPFGEEGSAIAHVYSRYAVLSKKVKRIKDYLES